MTTKQRQLKPNWLAMLGCFFAAFVVGGFLAIYLTIPGSTIIPDKTNNSYNAVAGDVNVELIKEQDLSIHFLELGNKYTGDCTLIKVGETEVLIDAGSRTSSVPVLKSYLDQYVTDGRLEYVIVTHAHQDHYAGFATANNVDGIFDLYDVDNLIEFANAKTQTKSNQIYKNYQNKKNKLVERCGTNVYTALDCVTNTNGATANFDLGHDVQLEILDQIYYHEVSTDENNHSVCCQVVYDDKYYLFTGDLEEQGEKSLLARNTLHEVELYKAGHHGSKTSSTSELLAQIKPKVVCVCCCAGSSEYTTNNANQFPTQDFINRVAPHTTKVFVTTLCVDYKANEYTSFNGNIIIAINYHTETKIYCSNNAQELRESDWFHVNRETPTAWLNAG